MRHDPASTCRAPLGARSGVLTLAVALIGGLVLACRTNGDDDDFPPDPCGYRARLQPCGDAFEDMGDPADGGGQVPPLYCVADLIQQVGLGRCETDDDCASWSETRYVPEGADPPHSRCLTFDATGERFCERFDDEARTCGCCRPGYPCIPTPHLLGCTEPRRFTYNDYRRTTCVRQVTRSGPSGETLAHITACVPGTPLYIEEACNAPPPE